MQNENAESAETSSKGESKTVLVVEIDITDAGDNWNIVIEKTALLLGPPHEKQIITKRSSREKLICLPEPDSTNFVKAIYIEKHNS